MAFIHAFIHSVVGNSGMCSEIDKAREAMTFPKPSYPMYVMSREDLMAISTADGLPDHETAQERGLLKEVVEQEEGAYFVYHTLPSGKRGNALTWHDFNPHHDNDMFETPEKKFNRAEFLTVSHRWLRRLVSSTASQFHTRPHPHTRYTITMPKPTAIPLTIYLTKGEP